MSDDVTEITCDSCTGASDWYCVKCWTGIVRELHVARCLGDIAKRREQNALFRIAELEQLLALRTRP
jgi:hypothetical protein